MSGGEREKFIVRFSVQCFPVEYDRTSDEVTVTVHTEGEAIDPTDAIVKASRGLTKLLAEQGVGR